MLPAEASGRIDLMDRILSVDGIELGICRLGLGLGLGLDAASSNSNTMITSKT
jgi:hypothetical protein